MEYTCTLEERERRRTKLDFFFIPDSGSGNPEMRKEGHREGRVCDL